MNTPERCSSAAGSPEPSTHSSPALTDDQLLDRFWAGTQNYNGGAGAAIPANNAESLAKPPKRLHVKLPSPLDLNQVNTRLLAWSKLNISPLRDRLPPPMWNPDLDASPRMLTPRARSITPGMRHTEEQVSHDEFVKNDARPAYPIGLHDEMAANPEQVPLVKAEVNQGQVAPVRSPEARTLKRSRSLSDIGNDQDAAPSPKRRRTTDGQQDLAPNSTSSRAQDPQAQPSPQPLTSVKRAREEDDDDDTDEEPRVKRPRQDSPTLPQASPRVKSEPDADNDHVGDAFARDPTPPPSATTNNNDNEHQEEEEEAEAKHSGSQQSASNPPRGSPDPSPVPSHVRSLAPSPVLAPTPSPAPAPSPEPAPAQPRRSARLAARCQAAQGASQHPPEQAEPAVHDAVQPRRSARIAAAAPVVVVVAGGAGAGEARRGGGGASGSRRGGRGRGVKKGGFVAAKAVKTGRVGKVVGGRKGGRGGKGKGKWRG